MKPLTVLLIQVRDPADAMCAHERACILRRMAGREVRLVTRNAVHTQADRDWLADTDAVVIGGSGSFSVHHPRSQRWVKPLQKLLDRILQSGMPGFGICFGHQLLGANLGSKIHTDTNLEEVGTVSLSLTDIGLESDVFAPLGADFWAQTGHSDHVVETPSGVELLAQGQLVAAQAFRVLGSRFYSTQFHPDLTAAEAKARYLAAYARPDGSHDDFVKTQAGRFDPRGDAAARILGHFVDAVTQVRSEGDVEERKPESEPEEPLAPMAPGIRGSRQRS